VMTRHRVVCIALVAIALMACGSSDDDASGGSDRSTQALPDTTAGPGSSQPVGTVAETTPPTVPPATDRPGNGDDGIDSVRWGPDDPPIPDEYAAFAADSAGGLSCDSIDNRADGDQFWMLARDICRVFTSEGDWPDAATVPPTPQDGNAYQRCLDTELSQMLDAALTWHAAHPGEPPRVRFPKSGTHSPCQTSLYDVALVDLHVDADDVCGNDESLDVPTPGIPVSVSAPGITGFANPRASVDGTRLCVIDDSQDNALRTFIVVVPTSGDEHAVTIAVETNYGTLSAAVTLPAIDVESTTVATPVPTDSEPTDSEPTDNGDETPTKSTDATEDEQGTPDDP
jgi:hypothetical protein